MQENKKPDQSSHKTDFIPTYAEGLVGWGTKLVVGYGMFKEKTSPDEDDDGYLAADIREWQKATASSDSKKKLDEVPAFVTEDFLFSKVEYFWKKMTKEEREKVKAQVPTDERGKEDPNVKFKLVATIHAKYVLSQHMMPLSITDDKVEQYCNDIGDYRRAVGKVVKDSVNQGLIALLKSMINSNPNLKKNYLGMCELGIKNVEIVARSDPRLNNIILQLFKTKLYATCIVYGQYSRANLQAQVLKWSNIQLKLSSCKVSSIHQYVGDQVDYSCERYRRNKRKHQKNNASSLTSTTQQSKSISPPAFCFQPLPLDGLPVGASGVALSALHHSTQHQNGPSAPAHSLEDLDGLANGNGNNTQAIVDATVNETVENFMSSHHTTTDTTNMTPSNMVPSALTAHDATKAVGGMANNTISTNLSDMTSLGHSHFSCTPATTQGSTPAHVQGPVPNQFWYSLTMDHQDRKTPPNTIIATGASADEASANCSTNLSDLTPSPARKKSKHEDHAKAAKVAKKQAKKKAALEAAQRKAKEAAQKAAEAEELARKLVAGDDDSDDSDESSSDPDDDPIFESDAMEDSQESSSKSHRRVEDDAAGGFIAHNDSQGSPSSSLKFSPIHLSDNSSTGVPKDSPGWLKCFQERKKQENLNKGLDSLEVLTEANQNASIRDHQHHLLAQRLLASKEEDEEAQKKEEKEQRLQSKLTSQVQAADSKAAQKEEKEAKNNEKERLIKEHLSAVSKSTSTTKPKGQKKRTSSTKRKGGKTTKPTKPKKANGKTTKPTKGKKAAPQPKKVTTTQSSEPTTQSSKLTPPSNANKKKHEGCIQHELCVLDLKPLEPHDTARYTKEGGTCARLDLAKLLQNTACKGECKERGLNLQGVLFYCQQCVTDFEEEDFSLSWYCKKCYETKKEKVQPSGRSRRGSAKRRANEAESNPQE